MDVTSTITAPSGTTHTDIENKETSGSPKVVDALPMLACERRVEDTTNLISEFSALKITILPSHREMVDRIIQNQITELTVDDESRQVMAEALAFSGINTLEQVESLKLRIIPPGPILHTWYASYGTGLFDGKNNPDHVKGLNYVARISEQADRLKEWGIPVLLVYLERDMPPSELMKMRQIFFEHDNILVMSLESDLSSLNHFCYYKNACALGFLDDMRFLLCSEFPNLLSLAKKKAEILGKKSLLTKLIELGGHSITYSDIDNTFLCKPMFQLARYGVRNVCPFAEKFSLQYDNACANYLSNQRFYELAQRHKDTFSHEGVACKRMERLPTDTLEHKANCLYNYLLSGEGRKNYRLLESKSDMDVKIFDSESPGYIALNKEAVSIIAPPKITSFSGYRWMTALMNKQSLDNQLLNLHGLQQVRQIHIGRDKTWDST